MASIIKTKLKYTPEQEQEMQLKYGAINANDLSEEAFADRDEIIQFLADKYNKTPRMIIAKLSKMELYIPKPRRSKVTGGSPEKKEDMIRRLEIKYGCNPGDLESVAKATKLAIQILLEER